MINIFVVYPYPNIVAITGARAGTGISCVKNIKGKRRAYTFLLCASITPNHKLTKKANTNPTKASLRLKRVLVNTL